jgi:hypothetical protein
VGISGTAALAGSDYYSSIEADTDGTITKRSVTDFDTGPGTYPGIAGTHSGTITPSQTISVSQLYTYPCAGTGGHSEYIKIWNSTWNISTSWNGYARDYHNIYFAEPFTLEANRTYNYTIKTGSCPQIHHCETLAVSGGVITCTEFVDTNGKIYEDWIPAIRLDDSSSITTKTMVPDATPPIVTSPSANPPVITNDGTTYSHLTVNVTDDTAVDIVTIDLSPIGGPSIYYLYCYGPNLFGCNVSAICDPGTYNLCVNATDIHGNSNTSVSITLSVISSQATISITTDKFEYSPSDTMTITIDIANPTEDSVTFQWYWGVPQYSSWVPIARAVPIPAGYNDTVDFSFTMPYLGSKHFGNVFYVQLLDASGEVLDTDAKCWTYTPGEEEMPARKVGIAKEIKKIIRGVELPS